MNAEQFIAANADKFESDYEKAFVRNVMAMVPGLDLSKVRCQTPFSCDGKHRRCDFTLENGVRIALEVDGYDKTGRGAGMTHSEFVDWLLRDGCLKEQRWTVLRFANVQVRDRADRCARNIQLVIQIEKARLKGESIAVADERELDRLEAERQLEVAELQTQVAKLGEEASSARAESRKWQEAAQQAQERAATFEREVNRLTRLAEQAVAERDSIRKDRDKMSSRSLIALALVMGAALISVALVNRQSDIQNTRATPVDGNQPTVKPTEPVSPIPTSAVTSAPSFNPDDYLGQGNKFNCGHFESQANAQAVLRKDPTDPNNLDGRDGKSDGIACESRPRPYDRIPVASN